MIDLKANKINKLITIISIAVLVTAGQICYGQTNKEQALAKAKQAVKLEDEEEKYDEAIKLLEEAQKLDPSDINYPYEIAYAYSSKKEYKKASDLLENLQSRKDVNSRVFQALGNAYDMQGNRDKANETYENGLKKFPNAGELYLESGNMKMIAKDYSSAVSFYERGIEKDPDFVSNYYWAAKIFLNSTERVWGMIYGEIFMNLERNSKRTEEISKLLFDAYRDGIKFTSDSSFNISFSKNAEMNINDVKDAKKMKLPFGIAVYEPLLSMAVLAEKTIDVNSLDRIRSRFITEYFKGEAAKNYPNVLFNYQLEIKQEGQMEAYNHWILIKGDEAEFESWQKENKTKWEKFLSWFIDHKIPIDKTHKFFREQY